MVTHRKIDVSSSVPLSGMFRTACILWWPSLVVPSAPVLEVCGDSKRLRQRSSECGTFSGNSPTRSWHS